MDKRQKCALKYALWDTIKIYVFLLCVLVLCIAGFVLGLFGVLHALEYLVTLYPWLAEPVVIPENVGWYLAMVGGLIFFGSIIYSDVKRKYDMWLKKAECNDKKEKLEG